jgi:hypothetical protein
MRLHVSAPYRQDRDLRLGPCAVEFPARQAHDLAVILPDHAIEGVEDQLRDVVEVRFNGRVDFAADRRFSARFKANSPAPTEGP